MTPEELEQFIHRELRGLPPRKAPAGFEARFQQALAARRARAEEPAARLEQLIHRELRALPPRKAPASLEARVLAEIERRGAVAWYHKSWSHWPAAVRSAFLALGTALGAAAVMAFVLLAQGTDTGALTSAASERVSGLVTLFHVFRWMAAYVGDAVAGIPPLWLYGGLALVGALYATFVGLGAAAYRTLYRNH
jgi:hypothetical protein